MNKENCLPLSVFPLQRVPFVWNNQQFVSRVVSSLSKSKTEYAIIDGFIYVGKSYDTTHLLEAERKHHIDTCYRQFLFYAPPRGQIMNSICEFLASTGVEYYIEHGRLYLPMNYDTSILFAMCVLDSKMPKEQ